MAKTISLYGFTSVEPPEAIKEFLEQYTDEGTIYAVEVAKPRKKGSRTHAKVQFTDTDSAEIIKALADQKDLWYGNSYLKAQDADHDIVPVPKFFLHSIDDVTMHFGCQTSKEKFVTFWKQENVSVKFGFKLRNFYFFLSFGSKKYKLELPYENIWQVELNCPQDQRNKFLVIQLSGAPKIYEEDKIAENVCRFYKEAADGQWIRQVDFTPFCSIGQSSALCLEFPRMRSLPKFEEFFVLQKENQGKFVTESRLSFSCSSDLVRIVNPPRGIDLPYDILFQVNSLVQHGYLPGPELDETFFRLIDPRRIPIFYIQHALDKIHHLRECCFSPAKWLQAQYKQYAVSGRDLPPLYDALDDGLVYVRRVVVTPAKVFFCGPEVILSNRVLRHFPGDISNFLRVSFVDEDTDRLFSSNLSPRSSSPEEGRHTSIYKRILSVLRNGVVIGDRKFEFLGFSQSQLRDNSLWMFASRPGLTSADIRNWMGDFSDIKNVAKYAARLGHCFSSSRETFNVERHETEIIPDLKIGRYGDQYIFSDGIGKISAEFADKIAEKLGFRSNTPSAFQIRYGGYKGVLAVDPTSSVKLSLRQSMFKFKSDNTSLDVLGWSRYQACFLNREVITLLSTLGIRDRVIQRKQKEAISQLDAILTDPMKAKEALELMAPGENTNMLKEMICCGYMPNEEPFLAMMLQTFRASKLFDMRTRTRIFIPGGRFMMGCLDETGTLEYGQVFVQYSLARHRGFHDISDPGFAASELDQQIHVCKDKVVVAKNPCLHPGDMRVLKAVDVPALHHMVDCIVFPQKGKRPHPNECSGSDLDGDVYLVSWDPDLIPRQQHPPMDYTAAEIIALDHDVTIEEVQEYFTDYILNDSLGIICSAHTVFADKEPSMARSKECKDLAHLASIAVDFPKTGVPATIPPKLRVKEYPDFMEKPPDKVSYKSQRIIGKLYRAVRDIAPDTSPVVPFTKDAAIRAYDREMEVDGFKKYTGEAHDYKCEYDRKLGNMMDYYGINTEAELLSGCIMKVSKSFDKKKNYDTIMLAVKCLRKQARTWFNETGNDEAEVEPTDMYAKASAWYHVTYHPTFWGSCNPTGTNRDHFLSFPWCVYDKLAHIKKSKAASHGTASGTWSIVRQFTDLLQLDAYTDNCVIF